MFVEFDKGWPPPEPWRPERPHRRMTKRQARAIGWIVGLNLALLLVGPFAGATIFDAIVVLAKN